MTVYENAVSITDKYGRRRKPSPPSTWAQTRRHLTIILALLVLALLASREPLS